MTTRASYTVLLAGSSAMYYTDTTPSDSLLELVRRALRERAPDIDWRCEMGSLQPTATMAARAETLVERHEPDAVVVCLSATPFAYEYAVHRIRRRWPRLLRLAERVTKTLKLLSGDRDDEVRSPRGWVFRLPRSAIRLLVGVEALVPLREAIENTEACLRTLLRFEHVATICRLPITGMRASSRQMRRYQALTQQHNASVAAFCEQHHVPHYVPSALLQSAGRPVTLAKDGKHMGLDVRQFEAEVLAGLVVDALQETTTWDGLRSARLRVSPSPSSR